MAVPSADRQREIIEAVFLEGLNKGDISVADKYLTPDFRNHGSHDDSMRGPAAFKNTIGVQRRAFSDMRYEILDFISMGDKAAIRWVMHGRHTGPFLGVQATDKVVEHHAIIWFRFEGEQIAERWGIVDNFNLVRFLRGEPAGPGGAGAPGGPGAAVPAGAPAAAGASA